MIIAEFTGLCPSLKDFIAFFALHLPEIIISEYLKPAFIQEKQLIALPVGHIYQFIQTIELFCQIFHDYLAYLCLHHTFS